MDSVEPCVPPGFRFHPTDEELVGYYLRKKVSSHKIDLDVIRDIDLYGIEPWDLQEYCRIGYEEQREWYFFNHKDKKYPTGTRTNRATVAGFWKATGRDKAVRDKKGLIGMRKTLVFYKGRAPNGKKTDWIIHEYRLESEENGPPQEEGWVVCRAFKKRANIQPTSADIWDSAFGFTADPTNNYLQSIQHNLLCKQETEVDNLHLLNSNFFVELPQLNNPSLLTLTVENKDGEQAKHCNAFETVTDWRALDKLAASQLSPEDRIASNQVTDFVVDKNSEMALLLLQASMEEASCIGIPLFEE